MNHNFLLTEIYLSGQQLIDNPINQFYIHNYIHYNLGDYIAIGEKKITELIFIYLN